MGDEREPQRLIPINAPYLRDGVGGEPFEGSIPGKHDGVAGHVDRTIALSVAVAAAQTCRQSIYDEMKTLPTLRPFFQQANALYNEIATAAGLPVQPLIERS